MSLLLTTEQPDEDCPSSNPLLEAALAAARRGWYVLPIYPAREDGTCACSNTECKNVGKHPLRELVGDGQTSATTDEATIRGWWAAYPDASVAAVMEPSGLFALDVDHPEGEEAAVAKLNIAVQKYGPLPSTPTQVSGSGKGWHVIFKTPGFAVRGELEKITCRGKNYILLAPSRHKSGGCYRWEDGASPDDVPVAELPDTWKAALRKPDPIGSVGVPDEAEEPDWLKVIPSERRLADMRAHLLRETGEKMGVDRPGKTRDVIKTAVRSHAVRDVPAALEAIQTILNPKNEPPYDDDALIDRLVFAYETSHTPEWGAAYEPREVRLAAFAASIGWHPSADEPAGPQAPRQDTLAQLLSAERKIASSKKPQIIQEHALLVALRKGEPLPCDSDQDLMEVQAVALKTVAKYAPADATTEELVAFVGRSILEPPEELSQLIEHFRPNHAGEPTSDEDVFAQLKRTDKGSPIARGDNIEKILRYAEATRDQFRFNNVTKEVEVTGGPFMNENVNDLPTALENWFGEVWDMGTSAERLAPQLRRLARMNSYEPVAEYLDCVIWDGVPRIESWLTTYCAAAIVDRDGTDISSYVSAVGWKWLLAAVARALKPGTKVDTVLILEGEQGAKKSMTFKILGGQWATNTPLVLGNKDSLMAASSYWICELSELASLKKSETEVQKAFLSADKDDYRPPYGKAVESFPRRCVFGGTVNPQPDGTVDYLRDETGDRRWWPVRVGDIDVVALARDRDQLWAEATARYHAGESYPEDHRRPAHLRWWFERHEQLVADAVAAHRHGENVWAEIILEWARAQVRGKGGIGNAVQAKDRWTLTEIGIGALGITKENLKRQERDITTALLKAGFVRPKSGTAGPDGRHRRWSHPDLSVPEVPAAAVAGERVVH